jgi:branched-chain amino acid transport system ATP-binding protein
MNPDIPSGTARAAPLLEVRELAKSFRGLKAVDGVSFTVGPGEIVALIGPNGAGKTTCFNVAAGVYRPDSGQVLLDGQRIDGLRADQICRAGIGRTFQIVKPFAGLTTEENVLVGALKTHPRVADARAKAQELLRMLGLWDKRLAPASALTLPERKRLEVGRALATEPRVLLLDEVMAGLRPVEMDQMVAVFRELNGRGLAILLIEHVMRAVMALSRHIVVLHYGRVIKSGTPEEVVRDPAVLECYLGEETA